MEATEFGRKKALKIVHRDLSAKLSLRFRQLTGQELWDAPYRVTKELDASDDRGYWISPSTNGHRGLLFMTKFRSRNRKTGLSEDRTLIVFIYTKNKELISLRMRFDPVVFENTILEGEMHRDSMGRYVFALSDIWMSCGASLMRQDFAKRREELERVMRDLYKADDYLDPFYFYIKPALEYTATNLMQLRGAIAKSEHKCFIGVAFRARGAKMGPETILLLVKPQSSVSTSSSDGPVILNINKGTDPDVYEVFCYRGTKLYRLGQALVPNIKASFELRRLFKDQDNHLMICEWTKDFRKWKPISVVDKHNSITHFEKVSQIMA